METVVAYRGSNWNLPGGTEQNHERQDNRRPFQD
jgi:hypothetical protein